MRLKKIVPYKIRRMVPMLGMAGATLLMGGCEKDEPVALHDVEVKIHQLRTGEWFYDSGGVRYPSWSIQQMLKDPSVRTVYLVPDGYWSNFYQRQITGMRIYTLEPLLNFSPKLKGKGDFDFADGEASKVPEDSLWYIEKGWTINKRFIEQKQR